MHKSKPSHLKGIIIETGSDSFASNFQKYLGEMDTGRMIVFLNAATYQKDELFISYTHNDIERMISVGVIQTLKISLALTN